MLTISAEGRAALAGGLGGGRHCFRVDDVPTDGKPKYYVLEMFPVPRVERSMLGHVRNYTLG